jgi:polyisoprenoid-binding protein YceI
MKFILISLFFCTQLATAQNYVPADAAGSVNFRIRNFGLEVGGEFKGLKGGIQFDPNNPAAASFLVTAEASTVNTDNSLRDKHLRGSDYFDVARFPRISMKSVRVEKTSSPGQYMFIGKLNMKGVEKDISFPFTAVPGTRGIRFSGSYTINRRDFGVGGRSTVSSEVTIKLNVLGIMQ